MRLVATTAAVFVSAIALTVYSPSPASAVEPTNDEPNMVQVKPGDFLSKIAKKNDTTYKRLFNANTDIKHPDVIYPGDDIRIPSDTENLKSRSLPSGTPAPKQETAPAVSAAPTPAPAAPAPQPQAAAPAPGTPAPRQKAPAPETTQISGSVWDRLAQCESGGNWSINTGNGFYGGLQFTTQSWQAVGGSGLPSNASRSEQIARAQTLQSIQGWGAWPACSAKLGLL